MPARYVPDRGNIVWLERERVHTLRRRLAAHAHEMFLEERGDLRAAQIVFPDFHAELIPTNRDRLQARNNRFLNPNRSRTASIQ